jgi:hypothetical protein
MFISDELLAELNALRNQSRELLFSRLLSAYDEFRSSGKTDELAFVVSELAHWNAVAGLESLNRAEGYFSELESLEPRAQSKWISAAHYYTIRNYRKVIEKVDEIDVSDQDRTCKYSALVLKAQALVALNLPNDAGHVIDSLIGMVSENPKGLFLGDEVNLVGDAIRFPELRPKCQELLEMTIPKIRDSQFKDRGKELLHSLSS